MNPLRVGAAACLTVAVFAAAMGTVAAASETTPAAASAAPALGAPPVSTLLILIAALLAVLLMLGITALLTVHRYGRGVLNLLYDIREQGAIDSDETLPAIRGALSDVVDHLLPPPGWGGR